MLTNFIRKFRLSRAFKKLARENCPAQKGASVGVVGEDAN